MASSSILHLTQSEVLGLSQETSSFLKKEKTSFVPTVLTLPSVFSAESHELWVQHERLFLSCLQVSDDKAAHLCLERIIDRFGPRNEKVMGLRGIYQEAVAHDKDKLADVLEEYNEALAIDPINTPVAKRRITLLRYLSRTSDAVLALNKLLESSPTDIEAWAELSDMYLSQDLFRQAVFCLEEVLLVAPNAWNVHARIGEILFIASCSIQGSHRTDLLTEASRRFGRSIELCEGYIRGYIGLQRTMRDLLAIAAHESKQEPMSDGDPCSKVSMHDAHRLHELANLELVRIAGQDTDNNYGAADVAAVLITASSVAAWKDLATTSFGNFQRMETSHSPEAPVEHIQSILS